VRYSATRPGSLACPHHDTVPMTPDLDTIVNLAKKRGFVFQSSEIYGGLRSAYDYGPLGVELLRNVKDEWWKTMVRQRDDVVGIDSAVIQSPSVWVASGHVGSFSDPLVECKVCHNRFRPDKLDDPERCPECGSEHSFTEPREFELMFRTNMGPVDSDENTVYLRPETAQGIFINFENVQRTARKRLPFGIAQIGKSFRNEITPEKFIFRTREFEQMEMEYFCRPDESDLWFDYWKEERRRWYLDLGMREENLRYRQHDPDELSHYSERTFDIDYRFPWGFDELEGVAHRTDFDLKAHAEYSGEDLSYRDPDTDEVFVPHVVEPAAGVNRTALAFLLDAYHVEEVRGEQRVVLRLDPRLAPVKVAVLPLSRKDELNAVVDEVAHALRPLWPIEVDMTQSIGRRYRRQDEIGTPYAVTVDFDSLEDRRVTVRDRDSMEQDRLPIGELVDYLSRRLPG
jgi:glycyl-tRNA synthetase